jgi:hypothetical protein
MPSQKYKVQLVRLTEPGASTCTAVPKNRPGRPPCLPTAEIVLSELSGTHLGVIEARQALNFSADLG